MLPNAVKSGAPVYLTKNGYGTMVVLSIEAYSELIENTEDALDVADKIVKKALIRGCFVMCVGQC